MQIDFGSFKKALKPEMIITSVPGAYFSFRGRRCLMVEPETASWVVLSRELFDLLAGLGLLKPGQGERGWETLAGVRQAIGQGQEERTDRILYSLFVRNMVTINGLTHFQPWNLWPVQHYPHYFNIHVTESCNLACRYCRVGYEGGDAKMMTVETCRKIIRRVLEEIPGEKCIIGFHGGEPLLNIRCIVESARYVREVAASLGKTVTLSLQTNGILLRKHAGILQELGIEVGVSLDGPEHIHDRNRIYPSGKGSFTDVMNGIRTAREAGLRPGLLAVISDPDEYLEVARFFIDELKASSFRLNYSCYEGRAKRELSFEPDRAAAFAENWLKLVDLAWDHYQKTGIWLNIDDLNLFIAHLVAKERPHMCYRSPCGAGNAILGFGHDGRIYPCEELVGKDEFSLGSIDSPVVLTELLDGSEAYASLRDTRKIENIAKCAVCPWRRFHGSGCLNKSYEFFEDTEHEDPMCYFYKRVFEELMWMLTDRPELVNLIGHYRKYINVEEEFLKGAVL